MDQNWRVRGFYPPSQQQKQRDEDANKHQQRTTNVSRGRFVDNSQPRPGTIIMNTNVNSSTNTGKRDPMFSIRDRTASGRAGNHYGNINSSLFEPIGGRLPQSSMFSNCKPTTTTQTREQTYKQSTIKQTNKQDTSNDWKLQNASKFTLQKTWSKALPENSQALSLSSSLFPFPHSRNRENSSRKKSTDQEKLCKKPAVFVDSSGTVSGLDTLVRCLNPRESGDKFVVNAIVGTLASGKSTTLNKLLGKNLFQTRESSSSPTPPQNSTSKPSISAMCLAKPSTPSSPLKKDIRNRDGRDQADGKSDGPKDSKEDSNGEASMFEAHTKNVNVLLSRRTVGTWFLFDTPPLLSSNNASKRPLQASAQHNPSTKSKPLSSEQPSTSSSSTTIGKSNHNRQQSRSQLLKSTDPKICNKSSKNPTLLWLQTLTFLFVCSDNIVILLDPNSVLDELFSLLLTAIMIVGCPTATLHFYIPEEMLNNHLNSETVVQSVKERLNKLFMSKANFGLVDNLDELLVLLSQPKISRCSALVAYTSEMAWLVSAHKYWLDIDVVGNLLYQYCEQHIRVGFAEKEDKIKVKDTDKNRGIDKSDKDTDKKDKSGRRWRQGRDMLADRRLPRDQRTRKGEQAVGEDSDSRSWWETWGGRENANEIRLKNDGDDESEVNEEKDCEKARGRRGGWGRGRSGWRSNRGTETFK